ncbi:MoxR family ATPase [Ramlibacter sp. 2FC]|uniref:AAA family ATPase n=1 Tax=Ramlibacter sp. 2FC TaxID=2502188 RepID=UPI0010F6FD66|nr:MoxR family ATPase [Ramlibacter sp. 2FC]
MTAAELIPDVEKLIARLEAHDYFAARGLAVALFCTLRLPQPLLLEGEAGVGKTQAAKSLAAMLGSPLIRLQCFEGISASQALYEWNYPRQLLDIRLAEARGDALDGHSLFSREYLLRRPLLQALEHPGPMPAVLLVDEVDRADEEFEAFLLEMLSEAAITIPELGTIRAAVPPVVVLTSNRTRDLHDALKRRCLYHWIDYPDVELTTRIVRRRVPQAPAALAAQIAAAVQRLRELDVQKPPGLAEAIDWARAAQLLGISLLTAEASDQTLASVLKYREDQDVARGRGLAWIAGR